MQSQHFNQLAQEAQALAAEREDLLEIFYQQGKAAFQRALESDFEDKLALKESGDAFFRMLQQEEEDYRPHLFLGYFLMLMDDYEQSEVFLKRAQELNTETKAIPQLLKTLAEQKELPQFKSIDLSLPLDGQKPDLGLLYSECEALIQQRFKTVSAAPCSSALDPAELATLKNRLLGLERFWERVQPVLDLLAPHVDPETLANLVAPLRSQQKQLISAYGQSEQLIHLKKELGQATKAISEELKKVRSLRSQKDFAHFEETLEKIYDQCDHFADLVDSLGTQNPAVISLEKGYERLIKFVSQLQSEWESQKTRFPQIQLSR